MESSDIYRIVPLVEVGVASISGLSMTIPFIILFNTVVLHPNSKIILLFSQICGFGIVSIQVALVVCEYSKNVYLPVTIDGDNLFFHQFFNGMSTLLSLFLAMERFYACLNTRTDYEASGRSFWLILLILFVSVSSLVWCMVIQYRSKVFAQLFEMVQLLSQISNQSETLAAVDYYYIGMATVFCTEVAVIVLSLALSFYGNTIYQHETNYTISQEKRHQMYSRAFVSSICVSSLLNILGLIPLFLWKQGYGQYGLMRAVFFLVHSVNCSLMQYVFIMCHATLRKSLFSTFWCMLCRRRRNRVATSEEARAKATDNHFEMLSSLWK